MTYNGWTIRYYPAAPVTGRWSAIRFGVSICAGTEEALKRMIDQRIYEAREDRDRRMREASGQ